ncbi:MAG: hypothetical protein J4F36_09665 [Nitrosopumilaceae archaeon]|nr:hypothetical protein [Nitrosopumilaceae archaeon]
MKKITKISVTVVICISIILMIFFVVNDSRIKEQNESVHDMDVVKNCVPSSPNDPIPSIGSITNATHQFDLRNCEWK